MDADVIDEFCAIACDVEHGSPWAFVVESVRAPLTFARGWWVDERAGGEPVGALLFTLLACVPLNPCAWPFARWCVDDGQDPCTYVLCPAVAARVYHRDAVARLART
jgi:hypothetical protein